MGIADTVDQMVQDALARSLFQAVIVSVSGSTASITRPGQRKVDPQAYPIAEHVTGLQPGDAVSVVRNGANLVIMGKIP